VPVPCPPFGADIGPWPDMSARALRAQLEHDMDVFDRLERLPLPVIAAVHGHCLGGGFELAQRADVIFAGESVRFSHPEQSWGEVTLHGGVYRAAERAGKERAMESALTSEQVPATMMATAGMVNQVVAGDALLSEAEAFARQLATGLLRAHAAYKALLRDWRLGERQ
jgi:enoyl-CoA hydratase/carnithine racemase